MQRDKNGLDAVPNVFCASRGVLTHFQQEVSL